MLLVLRPTGSPSILMVPSVGTKSPFASLIRVDFPLPLGPSNPTIFLFPQRNSPVLMPGSCHTVLKLSHKQIHSPALFTPLLSPYFQSWISFLFCQSPIFPFWTERFSPVLLLSPLFLSDVFHIFGHKPSGGTPAFHKSDVF